MGPTTWLGTTSWRLRAEPVISIVYHCTERHTDVPLAADAKLERQLTKGEFEVSEAGLITVNDVNVAGDLHSAVVFVSILGNPCRFLRVDGQRGIFTDITKGAVPGADRAQDQEGGLPLAEAFGDVGAGGFLADRVQPLGLHQRVQRGSRRVARVVDDQVRVHLAIGIDDAVNRLRFEPGLLPRRCRGDQPSQPADR